MIGVFVDSYPLASFLVVFMVLGMSLIAFMKPWKAVVLASVCASLVFASPAVLCGILALIGLVGALKLKVDVRPSFRTEPAHWIRANKTMNFENGKTIYKGYPLTVNEDTVCKAVATGDYDYMGRDMEAGGFYTNDGSGRSGGSYVPSGEMEVTENCYLDERLN